jgi:hypothetical protein
VQQHQQKQQRQVFLQANITGTNDDAELDGAKD